MSSERPRGSGGPELTPELRAVEARLRAARFAPRASLGAEIAARLRRSGAAAAPDPRSPRFRLGPARIAAALAPPGAGAVAAALAAALAGAVAAGGGLSGGGLAGIRLGSPTTAIDRCCYDLDGGGPADDGVLIEVRPGERVRRLRVYEDRDRSGGWSRGDLVRFARGPEPVLRGGLDAAPLAVHRCCDDYDGGGLPDDGLLVMRAGVDRVVLAAIYDTRASAPVAAGPASAPGGRDAGWPLR